MRILVFCLLLFATPAVAADLLFARGRWAAVRHGSVCEGVARPLAPASEREPQARAGLTFGGGRNGTFHARLSRVPRPGSSVLLKIGQQPFLLVAQGPWAWSRGQVQDLAIIAAVRRERVMRIEGRGADGRRFADLYPLDGAPTAIDAAAAGCAGKI
jgi:hypothetical protein